MYPRTKSVIWPISERTIVGEKERERGVLLKQNLRLDLFL